ncbi:MAG: YncE family protein [Candidatus Xenobiia bacterium LiM19]
MSSTIPLQAQGYHPPWTAVLNPADGKAVESYRFEEPCGKSSPPDLPYADYTRWELLPEEKRPDLKAMKLPAAYRGKNIHAEAWRIASESRVLVFLSEKPFYVESVPGNVDGDWVVVDPATGSIVFDLKFHAKSLTAGRSLSFEPGISAWGRYAALDIAQKTTEIYDIAAGKKLASLPVSFKPYECHGIWAAGGFIYVQTGRGLSKVDPSSGRMLWSYPHVGRIKGVRLHSDGRLYVAFDEDPHTLQKSLKQAASQRFHGKDFYAGIIPYKNSYFGSTRTGGWNGKKIAVWELLHGKWSFIFEYHEDMAESEKDRLYAKNRFSSKMRGRLEWRAP